MTASDGGGPRRYVVVGAGIAGAAAADHLARHTDGEVVVLERASRPAAATTAKSGAFVGFWGHESPADAALLRYGIDYYRDVLADPATRASFVHGGRLRLATTDAGERALRADFQAWVGDPARGETATGEVGAPVQFLAGDALDRTLLLPGLDTAAVSAALYSPGVGFVDRPATLARVVLARALEAGATLETDATVTEILADSDAVRGVRVDGEDRPADAVVCAAGPWNQRLLGTAGVDLDVRHTRGPMLALDADVGGLPALFFEEAGVYTRPNRDGSVLVGHYPGEYDAADRLDPEDVSDVVPAATRSHCLETAADHLPALAGAAVREEWVGVRTLTPDGEPIVGETRVSSLGVASFNANGVQYAPAAGRLLAAAVAGSDGPTGLAAGLPWDAVAPGRFED